MGEARSTQFSAGGRPHDLCRNHPRFLGWLLCCTVKLPVLLSIITYLTSLFDIRSHSVIGISRCDCLQFLCSLMTATLAVWTEYHLLMLETFVTLFLYLHPTRHNVCPCLHLCMVHNINLISWIIWNAFLPSFQRWCILGWRKNYPKDRYFRCSMCGLLLLVHKCIEWNFLHGCFSLNLQSSPEIFHCCKPGECSMLIKCSWKTPWICLKFHPLI